MNIYRIAQEALANIRRHARAHGVSVALVHSHPDLILRIADDGVGFDVEQKCAEAADSRCMGLLGMEERAAILGATPDHHQQGGEGNPGQADDAGRKQGETGWTTQDHSPGG